MIIALPENQPISHVAGMEDPVAGSQSGAVTVASLKATKSMLGFEDGNSSGSSSEAGVMGKRGKPGKMIYPLVIQHNYGKSPFIVNFPMKNGDFP